MVVFHSSAPLLLGFSTIAAAFIHQASAATRSDGRPDFSTWTKPTSYWVPPIEALGLDCIDNSVKAGDAVRNGAYYCITTGEAICFNNSPGSFGQWTFGLKEIDGVSQACLWDPKNEPVWCLCNGNVRVSQICIGEDTEKRIDRYSQERPYLIFYDDKIQDYVAELQCDGTDGKDDKNLNKPTQLRMVDNSHIGQYTEYPVPVVKLKKGLTEDPEDENDLFMVEVGSNGVGTYLWNENKCTWTDTCPSESPSSTPSLAPSSSPSEAPSGEPSSSPSDAPSLSFEPSSEPSSTPSSSPSNSPSDMPSSNPTLSEAPSPMPSALPSSTPSLSFEPSSEPSSLPSAASSEPSGAPSAEPSSSPSSPPTFCEDEDAEAILPSYWVPPLDAPGIGCENKRLKIPDHGEFTCMPVGEGICRDNGGNFGQWRFGIEEVPKPLCDFSGNCPQPDEFLDATTFPVLIDPATTRYPLTGTTYTDSNGEICKNDNGQAIRGCNYAGTTHICIGENTEEDFTKYSKERPYMFFYNEKTHKFLYQLVCDAAGEQGKLSQLKMINNEILADDEFVKYPVDIVKLKKGPTPDPNDQNNLWSMYVDWNGFKDTTKQLGELAAFISVTHPSHCTEYVGATTLACWTDDCDEANVATKASYEVADCSNI